MEQLNQCINILYGGTCTSGTQLQEANQWLTNFQQKPESYNVCMNILQKGEDIATPLIFYCVQTILLSIKKRNKKPQPTGKSNKRKIKKTSKK